MARRLQVLGSLLLLGLAGCGSDTQEKLINRTLSHIEEAGLKVRQIQEELAKALKEAAGDKNKFKSPKVHVFLQKAQDLADELKITGKKLTEVKQKIDQDKELFTPEQQADNAKKFESKLNSTVETLVLSRVDLQNTIREIEEIIAKTDVKDVLNPFKEKLLEADGQFESLNRPR